MRTHANMVVRGQAPSTIDVHIARRHIVGQLVLAGRCEQTIGNPYGRCSATKTCTKCSGSGNISSTKTCSSCSGSGKVTHSTCSGSGKITHSTCSGRGYTTSSRNCSSHNLWASHYYCTSSSSHGKNVNQYH